MKESVDLSGSDPKSFRCCLCCHVKTGTLFYGIFVALGHIAFLGLLIFAAIHPDVLLQQQTQPHYDGIVVHTENGNFFQRFGTTPAKQQITKEPSELSYAILLLTSFYFCLSCLTVVGCFTYAPNIKQWVHDKGMENYPGVDHLMTLDSDYLMLLFITLLILILSIMAYLIGMVWSCYKYIQLHVASRSVVREYSVDPDTEMLLPPRYEDAIKVPENYPQPPAYSRD